MQDRRKLVVLLPSAIASPRPLTEIACPKAFTPGTERSVGGSQTPVDAGRTDT